MIPELSSSDQRLIAYAFQDINKINWDRNLKLIDWSGYWADLQALLSKASNVFHTKYNVNIAAIFFPVVIKDAYKANCSLKPHCLWFQPLWWTGELLSLTGREGCSTKHTTIVFEPAGRLLETSKSLFQSPDFGETEKLEDRLWECQERPGGTQIQQNTRL